jgi:hypothetical protein
MKLPGVFHIHPPGALESPMQADEVAKTLKQAQHDRKRLDQLEPQVGDLLERVETLESLVRTVARVATRIDDLIARVETLESLVLVDDGG